MVIELDCANTHTQTFAHARNSDVKIHCFTLQMFPEISSSSGSMPLRVKMENWTCFVSACPLIFNPEYFFISLVARVSVIRVLERMS